MGFAWLLYILALAASLGVAWTWFPHSKIWMWLLGLVAVVLLAPWRVHPTEDAGLAPALGIVVLSLAFEPEEAFNALRALAVWVLLAAIPAALVQAALWWWRKRTPNS